VLEKMTSSDDGDEDEGEEEDNIDNDEEEEEEMDDNEDQQDDKEKKKKKKKPLPSHIRNVAIVDGMGHHIRTEDRKIPRTALITGGTGTMGVRLPSLPCIASPWLRRCLFGISHSLPFICLHVLTLFTLFFFSFYTTNIQHTTTNIQHTTKPKPKPPNQNLL